MALPPRIISKAGLIPVGFQTFSLSNSTAQSVNSTCRVSNVLDVSIETQNARYRADVTAPTLTTGVLLSSGEVYRFEGFNGTANLKFQRATGTCKVSIQAWRYQTRTVS